MKDQRETIRKLWRQRDEARSEVERLKGLLANAEARIREETKSLVEAAERKLLRMSEEAEALAGCNQQLRKGREDSEVRLGAALVELGTKLEERGAELSAAVHEREHLRARVKHLEEQNLELGAKAVKKLKRRLAQYAENSKRTQDALRARIVELEKAPPALRIRDLSPTEQLEALAVLQKSDRRMDILPDGAL